MLAAAHPEEGMRTLATEELKVFQVRLPEGVSSLDNARIIFRKHLDTAVGQGVLVIEVTIQRDYDMERALCLLGLLNRNFPRSVVVVPRGQCSPALRAFAEKYDIELKVQPT